MTLLCNCTQSTVITEITNIWHHDRKLIAYQFTNTLYKLIHTTHTGINIHQLRPTPMPVQIFLYLRKLYTY
jgi:hypothetical protein